MSFAVPLVFVACSSSWSLLRRYKKQSLLKHVAAGELLQDATDKSGILQNTERFIDPPL